MLPVKLLRAGSKAQIKSKLVNTPRLTLTGKKANKSDDSIMSYHAYVPFTLPFYTTN